MNEPTKTAANRSAFASLAGGFIAAVGPSRRDGHRDCSVRPSLASQPSAWLSPFENGNDPLRSIGAGVRARETA